MTSKFTFQKLRDFKITYVQKISPIFDMYQNAINITYVERSEKKIRVNMTSIRLEILTITDFSIIRNIMRKI